MVLKQLPIMAYRASTSAVPVPTKFHLSVIPVPVVETRRSVEEFLLVQLAERKKSSV